MSNARRMHDWDQVSLLWAAIANTVRDPKRTPKPFSPGMVHPLRSADEYESKPVKADITVLKMLLPNRGKTK